MKKLIAIASIVSVCALLVSCGTKEEEKSIETPSGMVALDLSKYGKPFSIFVPDTTTSKLSVVEQSWGALEIQNGKGFQLSINEDIGDVELMKSDIKSNEVNVFKSYVTEEPTTLFWESEITKPEYHFYTIQKMGSRTFVLQDIVSENGDVLNKEQIQKMLDSAKKLVEKVKPNA